MARKRSMFKKLRDIIIRVVVWCMVLFGKIMPESIKFIIGGLIGRLGYSLARRDRERAFQNLEMVKPELNDKERIRLVKDCFRHFGRMILEITRIPTLKKKWVEKNISFEGLEIVRHAVESGRGIVVATGHIGNWELMGASAAQLDIPVNVIARELYDPYLNNLIIDLRKRGGINTIIRESSASAREILRSLRSGQMLALLIDQDLKVDGEFVEFFGKMAFTPTGAAILARKTGAVFAAAAIHRLKAGKHKIVLKEIEITSSGDERRDSIEATKAATLQLETWIRERPEQWPWFHRRWRTRPEGDGVVHSPKSDV